MPADVLVCALGAVVILAGVLWQVHARYHYAATVRRAVRTGRRLPSRPTVGATGAGILIVVGLGLEVVAVLL